MEVLLKFVAGEISVQEFEHEIYYNAELEDLLKKSTDWSGTYIGNAAANLYDYLIALNYSNTNGKINALNALELYFTKEGIPFPKSNEYTDFYSVIFASQPKYLDVDIEFIEKYILPSEKNLQKTELKKLIRSNFDKYFKFQSKPPRWIQNPQWIIKNDKPLYFIGQLDLKSELFHDNGVVYIFMDNETGEIDTIKQFY